MPCNLKCCVYIIVLFYVQVYEQCFGCNKKYFRITITEIKIDWELPNKICLEGERGRITWLNLIACLLVLVYIGI